MIYFYKAYRKFHSPTLLREEIIIKYNIDESINAKLHGSMYMESYHNKLVFTYTMRAISKLTVSMLKSVI